MNTVNIDRHLIFIKGEDKTREISHWEYENGKIKVHFLRAQIVYVYNPSNFECYTDPEELAPRYHNVFVRGKILTNVQKIQRFKKHFRIFDKSGHSKIYEREDIGLVPSCLKNANENSKFEYLKELARADQLKGADGTVILGAMYERIDFVRQDSVLSDYLKGECVSNPPYAESGQTIIYPFGFNGSQKQAVERALNNKLSVIEGPPGTGKTQTILNIIANIVLRGETVAVVSSNNSATQNIEEKLKKYGVDFISAFLGSSDHKAAFIQKQKVLPSLEAWKTHGNGELLKDLHDKLSLMLEKKNSLAIFKQELEEFKIQKKHFMEYYTESSGEIFEYPKLYQLKSETLLKFLAKLELMAGKGPFFMMWNKIIIFFEHGIFSRQFYRNSVEQQMAICQRAFYTRKIRELEESIQSIQSKLDQFDFDSKMKEYTALSMDQFKGCLFYKYKEHTRQSYTEEDLWKKSSDFIKDYPVVLSTTHSLRSSLSSKFSYDYVIVDEASQVNIVTGALAFSCARKAIVVGDLKQLPNVVDSKMKKISDAVFEKYQISEAYRFSNHSLLSSIIKLFPNVSRTLLREHYRCHPLIINFCNQKFYKNELIVLTESKEKSSPLAVYRSSLGNHVREGHINRRQIEMIAQEIIPEHGLDPRSDSIGIVTPYRSQADELQKVFGGTAIKADTVDKFQGQECKTIILSTVDDNISDFADNDYRLNVAISRAIEKLIVVVTGNPPTRQTGIGDLINYISYHKMEIIDSKIHSIFDLLLKPYAEIRREMLKEQKKVSIYDSENLMYATICEVLNELQTPQYDVVTHIPLRMLIRDISLLSSERQRGFALNELTHVDFLIFDKINRRPVLVIEVDGVSFHKSESRQAERDQLKNEILKCYCIPWMRFRTNESNEKVRLKEMLLFLMGEGGKNPLNVGTPAP